MQPKRQKGLIVSRGFLYGNTATLLTDVEKERLPPESEGHTHQWTIYFKGFQGDDLSYLVKRVTIKLHDSFKHARRVLEKPPWQVTETGWGEFEALITVTFHDLFNEKAQTLSCHLRLHDPVQLQQKQLEEQQQQKQLEEQQQQQQQQKQLEEQQQRVGADKEADGPTDIGASLFLPAVPAETLQPVISHQTLSTAHTTDAFASTQTRPQERHTIRSELYDEFVFVEPNEALAEACQRHPPTLPDPLAVYDSIYDEDYETKQLERLYQAQSEVGDVLALFKAQRKRPKFLASLTRQLTGDREMDTAIADATPPICTAPERAYADAWAVGKKTKATSAGLRSGGWWAARRSNEATLLLSLAASLHDPLSAQPSL